MEAHLATTHTPPTDEVINELLNKQYFFVKFYIVESPACEMTIEHLENMRKFVIQYGCIVAITSGHEVSSKGKHHTHIHFQMRYDTFHEDTQHQKKKLPTSPMGQIYKRYTQTDGKTLWFTEKYAVSLEKDVKSIDDIMGYPFKTFAEEPTGNPLAPVIHGKSTEELNRLWIRAVTIKKRADEIAKTKATKNAELETGYEHLEQYIEEHYYDHLVINHQISHPSGYLSEDMYKVAYHALEYYRRYKKCKLPWNVVKSIHRFAWSHNLMSTPDLILTLKLF